MSIRVIMLERPRINLYARIILRKCSTSVSVLFTSDPYNGLAGGWAASVVDYDQWFQVDMKEPYRFMQMMVCVTHSCRNALLVYHFFYETFKGTSVIPPQCFISLHQLDLNFKKIATAYLLSF